MDGNRVPMREEAVYAATVYRTVNCLCGRCWPTSSGIEAHAASICQVASAKCQVQTAEPRRHFRYRPLQLSAIGGAACSRHLMF